MKRTTLCTAALLAALGAVGAAQAQDRAWRDDMERDGRDRGVTAERFHRGGPMGDIDRDGIPNRYDRDRDGDGIANADDIHPDVYDIAARGRFGPNGDIDRDGIRNRDDRDRDGDGVPNHRDRFPDDGRYY